MAGRRGAAPPDQGPQPSRVVVERVRPQVDGGRFAVKRVVGERVVVTADAFSDGHDEVRAALLYRRDGEGDWREVEMVPLGNDAWQASFTVSSLEPYVFTVEAWLDPFLTWRRDLAKKVEAGQDVRVHLLVGAKLLRALAEHANGSAAAAFRTAAGILAGDGATPEAARAERALDEELAQLAVRHADRGQATRYTPEVRVTVDRERARFSTWYEMFPRSAAKKPGRHASFRDCEARLPYVAGMGFDVLYLPPIHPIGITNRKGKNGRTDSASDDVGSPWAIGAAEGGHMAIHPQLGSLEDFRRLVAKARELGLEIALDLALQCSPDHPWVKEHPEWFHIRPDGSVQHAENPPKKYEDIYPLNFETGEWRSLWEEVRRVVFFWIEQGVRIYRVDNPHTKPFAMWEWLIAEVRREQPEVLFLSEAFTRPKVMYRLAKLGFSQSYTYFAWRNTKPELTEYFTELTATPVREFLRPNLWPNTPDILTEALQYGGRPAFLIRLVLAATLGASYGIYGPAFELLEARPRTAGSEEYLDSEKYEVRHWEVDRPDSLRDFIARVNRIRRENPALQSDGRLRFHPVDNEQLLAYSKTSEEGDNTILTVVNLDPHHGQSGFVDLPVEDLGLGTDQPYQVHDLLTDARFFWHGRRNYVELDPAAAPAHVFRIRRRLRTERDFDYFL